MKRKLLTIFILIILSISAFAQMEVKEDSFKEVPGFVNINPDPNYQTDDNELPFAVIKVRTENINDKQRRELKFSGNAGTFIMLEYKDGEVWVYLTAKYADYLKISHPDFSSVEFTLPFDLEPKKGYEMTLVNKTLMSPDLVGYITVKSTPKGAYVMIDNDTVGVTPYLSEKLSVGNHKISVNLYGYEMAAKRVNIEKGLEEVVEFILVHEDIDATNIQNDITSNRINNNGNTVNNKFDYKTFTVNGVSFDMVYVKGGTFTMGGTSEQGNGIQSDEKPTHNVTLNDYYIGKFLVTRELWQAVMGNDPSSNSFIRSNILGKDIDGLPVDRVSWNDCQQFVTELNHLTGEEFRLPTEAEWEYAARGGNKSNHYKYSGSNIVDDVAWYKENSLHSLPVGWLLPNELGIYDMSGNLYEWCQDWYGKYNDADQMNPIGPSKGAARVVRGGRWGHYANRCRVSYRSKCKPNHKNSFNGFRIALDVQ